MIDARNEQPILGIERLEELQRMQANGLSEHEILGKLIQASSETRLDRWITQDPNMLLVKDRIRQIHKAHSRHPVLITGPTGTGKELLARALTTQTDRQDNPFLPVNCGGLAKDLVPSLFFGHKKGSFTGAVSDSAGVLVTAGHGMVFLDEIYDLPLELQATLLRAIQESEVYPVGSVQPVKINCHFVAATKYDLRQAVHSQRFREDLFARLYTFELRISSLRDRPDDIPLIAEHLGWNMLAEEQGYDIELPREALEDIYLYNVRAIQTFIERMRVYGTY